MKKARPAPKKSALPAWLQWKIADLPGSPEPDGVVRARAAVRMIGVGLGIGLGYLVLAAQATSLMLLPDSQLEAKASDQFEAAVEVDGRRGDIVDRNGVLMATTVDLIQVRADPAHIDQGTVPALSAALAPLIKDDAATIAGKLGQKERRDVLLARGLTPEEVAEVKKVAPRDGIFYEAEPQRYYPGRADAAALIGVVGRNGDGLAGIEQSMDGTLRGEAYRYVEMRDRKGRQIEPTTPVVEAGHTIVLTLDRQIQRIAEAAVDTGWARMQPEAMHAVVMDIKTGEILALVNRPTQNANDTEDLDMNAFKDHVVMDAFEPGSVFKPFVAAAALEEHLVTPDTKVDAEGGSWMVAGKVIHDDHPHGVITVAEVIKYSSNIGAAKLAFMLGADRTLKYLTGFGFGRSTGLGLPGETRGLLRSAAEIKPIELATTAYGHGVSASTMQLVAGMGTLGNGGIRLKPHVIKEIRDSHGEVLRRTEPEEDGRVVSEETARKTVDMMEGVTEEGGTGTHAQVPGYLVAGKTGTAWKHIAGGGYSATDRIGSFVGMLPANDPKILIAVVVDTPSEGSKYGGLTAGPVFSEIGTEVMRLMGVPPDPTLLAEQEKEGTTPKPADEDATADDQAEPPVQKGDADLVWVDQKTMRAPELQGLSLRDALSVLQGADLQISISGSGRVQSQFPAPGQPIPTGSTVQVVLR